MKYAILLFLIFTVACTDCFNYGNMRANMNGDKIMLKPKFRIILFICMIALVGCSKDNNVKENEYSLQDSIRAFESQNVKLTSFGKTGAFPTLNKIIPEVYSIEGEVTVDHSNPEFVYFYIFKTEAARKFGKNEFYKQMKNAKFSTYPFLYEKGNILTIYWAKSKERPLFNEPIKSAFENV